MSACVSVFSYHVYSSSFEKEVMKYESIINQVYIKIEIIYE